MAFPDGRSGFPAGLLLGAPLLLAGAMLYRSRAELGRRAGGWLGRFRRVRDVMSRSPVSCTPATPLRDVAALMVTNDCGAIPVADEAGRPIGVVTDRDIACRLVAKGRDPLQATAADAMSQPVVTCTPDTTVAECARLMERHQVRRVPVVDASGALCGIVAQADLARRGPRPTAASVLRQVSEPNVFASATGGA